ncbi:DUF1428 domain-containing protein [Asticcacaulis sp. BYS171W]|uniref:DUF1428 domain-containing protein n=1 Tax=Asticcacaulis aquaticus TaxID=2984212 RepID=A0ABT5HRI7_9CAUL|nr:DUF1428 domain-containing protein [Asticcacaulis aquaticus]MDC7682677.1 DUF1428 domain-containing protein [Asticcacaulis aquaticus]
MSYVDGFVCPVKNEKKDAYLESAIKAADIFKEYGAVAVWENWGNDIPEGEVTSFPLSVKLQDGETVVFSWIVWPSKAVRDDAWGKLMQDDRMKMEDMPFDGKRMFWGGFENILSV